MLQTDPIQWVNQKSQVIKDLHVLDQRDRLVERARRLRAVEEHFNDKTVALPRPASPATSSRRTRTRCSPASSIVESVSDLTDVPGAPPRRADRRRGQGGLRRRTHGHPAVDRRARDGALNLDLPHRARRGLDARAVVVREIRDDRRTRRPACSATPSGLAVVGVGLLDNLEANRVLLTYLAILFVFLFLAVRLRSIVRALLSLVPVLDRRGRRVAVRVRVLHLKLSPMTAVGGPLVVAACTEFTSLILLRFVEERRRGSSPRDAVDVTASRTGRAFIVSALTAIVGRRGHRDVVAPAAARLRHRRRAERRGCAAQRARRPAADARLGRRAQLGLAGPRPRRHPRPRRQRA